MMAGNMTETGTATSEGAAKRIKNVIFDVHGVLQPKSDIPIKEFNDMCASVLSKKLGIGIEEALGLYLEERKSSPTTTTIMQRHGCYDEYKEAFHALPHKAKPDKRTISLLHQLKGRGFKLFISTNSPRYFALSLLGELGIDAALFDRIVTVDETEPRPSKQQFEIVFKFNGGNENGSKEEYLMLGDRYDVDIKPALEFGFAARLVDNDLNEILEDILS